MKAHPKNSKTLRVAFFGTPNFAIPALELLSKNEGYELFVITAPARPVGRTQTVTSSPVKKLADKLGLPVLQPETLRNLEFAEKLVSLAPDVLIVAAYGKILPQELLDLPPYGALNIHPSLLPKYRGPSPIEAAILNGEVETGVSIMQMDAEIDHGPVLAQEIVTLNGDETSIDLSDQLAKIGARLLLNILPDWIAGNISPTPQNHEHATYTKRLEREDGRIFWDNPANVLERQVRAYISWPESYFTWQRKEELLRIKVEKARVIEDRGSPEARPVDGSKPYGTVYRTIDAPIAVETLNGALAIDVLKLEGKSSTTATEFINGYPDIIGARLL